MPENAGDCLGEDEEERDERSNVDDLASEEGEWIDMSAPAQITGGLSRPPSAGDLRPLLHNFVEEAAELRGVGRESIANESDEEPTYVPSFSRSATLSRTPAAAAVQPAPPISAGHEARGPPKNAPSPPSPIATPALPSAGAEEESHPEALESVVVDESEDGLTVAAQRRMRLLASGDVVPGLVDEEDKAEANGEANGAGLEEHGIDEEGPDPLLSAPLPDASDDPDACVKFSLDPTFDYDHCPSPRSPPFSPPGATNGGRLSPAGP
eukprot:tig00020780_g13775.t1